MSLMQNIKMNYLPMFDDDKEPGFLSKPVKLKIWINDNGVLCIKDKRYLRLGKITLLDAINNKSITNSDYVGILDTLTGEVMCFDVQLLYKDYIKKGIKYIYTKNHGKIEIVNQTRKIVEDCIMDEKLKTSNHISSVDFV